MSEFPQSAEVAAASRRARILVVDDDDDVREVVAELLRADGYDVITAAGGNEALALIEAAGGWLDLVLTDIRMPGMSGVELARRVHARWPAVRLVLMTGYAGTSLAEAAEVDGWAPLLRKPFSNEELHGQIEQALGTGAGVAAH